MAVMSVASDYDSFETLDSDSSIMRNIDVVNTLEPEKILPTRNTWQTQKLLLNSEPLKHFSIEMIGNFRVTVDALRPVKPWKAAQPGTADKYAGAFAREVPELDNVTTKQIDQTIDEFRSSE